MMDASCNKVFKQLNPIMQTIPQHVRKSECTPAREIAHVTCGTFDSINALKRGNISKMNGRTRSASLGRDKKSDLKARYWAFLFENLQHAVDELYQTCEMDENISECKEVILVLENYTREFHNLTEWFRVKWEYENTPPPQRPNSLAWEVRKSSPGKIFRKKYQPALNGVACRELLFELSKDSSFDDGGMKRFAAKPIIGEGESKVCATCVLRENGDAEEEEKSSAESVTNAVVVVSSAKGGALVENWSQTDEGIACTAIRKPSTNVGRKMTSNTTSYLKKMSRSFTISNASEVRTPSSSSLTTTTTTTTATTSSLSSTKRLPVCGSPRKPVPGRNTDAPEFVPAKKHAAAAGLKSPAATNEKKIAVSLVDTAKTRILRSQSDPVFETCASKVKNVTTAVERSPYLSVECVVKNNGDEEATSNKGVSISPSLASSVHSLHVIEETKRTNNFHAASKNTVPMQLERKNDAIVKNAVRKKTDDKMWPMSGNKTWSPKSTPTGVAVKSVVKTLPRSGNTTEKRPENKTENTRTDGDRKHVSVQKYVRSAVATRCVNDDRLDVSGVAGATDNASGRGAIGVSSSSQSDKTWKCNAKTAIDKNLEDNDNNRNEKSANNEGTGNCTTNTTGTSCSVRIERLPATSFTINRRNGALGKSRLTGADEKNKVVVTTKKNLQNGEKWRFSKTNHHLKTEAKSNSFQEGGLKRTVCGAHSANMIRSKTSIDLKCHNGDRNRVVAKGGNKNNAENECHPRHRRSSKDTDGWETVVCKSRRSVPNSFNVKNRPFDVNNRFHEPSSSTSLPILILEDVIADKAVAAISKNQDEASPRPVKIDVKCKPASETKHCNNKNRNRNNSHGSNNSSGYRETCSAEKTNENAPQAKDNDRVAVDYRDYKLRKERPIISNTAIFTTIQPKQQQQQQQKKKQPNEKENRKSKGAGCGGGNYATGNVAKRKYISEANERGDDDGDGDGGDDLLDDDEESLRKSKELYEKEISLQKEINELRRNGGDVDLETDVDSDSTEVDQEIVDLCNNNHKKNACERRAALEAKYSHILTNMTWAEQIETLDKLEELLVRDPSGKSLKCAKNFTSLKQFEDLVSRAPGRALELHQKLSSPSRKRVSPDSTILQHTARQAKAKRNREQLLQDKSAKMRELLNKVAEVKVMQAQLAEQLRESLEQKLKRAEENRNLHLRKKQEKAHDEAKKQKEIAFINELEAQNKRHDFYALRQEQEDRLQSILEERQRRLEEKAAKDAAVEERRKAIEAESQEKIEGLREKMRKREERIDREQQEKERERIKQAREKARDREDRLLALQAAQIANAEELKKKIQQKQENSARRHEESIELIRQKAIEIGTPRLTPYQINKLCSICNVVIDSEVFLLSHLKGKSHQEAVKKYREQFEASVKFSECSIITDAPADVLHEKRNRDKERQNTLRKRCKKIRHRLSSRSEEHFKIVCAAKTDKCKRIDSSSKGRILKSIKEIEKLINAQSNGGAWPNNAVAILERNLFEIIRTLEKGGAAEKFVFKEFDGFGVLSKIYNLAVDLPKNMSPYLPMKCFIVASNLLAVACEKNIENCLYVLLSNNMVQISDFLLNRLNLIMPNSDDRNGMVVYKADSVADVLMSVFSNILCTVTASTSNYDRRVTTAAADTDGHNADCQYDVQAVTAHIRDIVSYVVCTGVVDKLAVYCSSVHDNKSADSYFLLHCMELLTQLVETRRGNITNKEDSTQLMATLKATELVGAVSMLYAMLLHQDSMSNDKASAPIVLQSDVINVIIATLRLFSKVAELNLKFFQNILGAEGISLQVRHIISFLLRYCTCTQNDNQQHKHLLHQVIEFIGFFAINHVDNQLILQSGSTPTVLQQLSSLPFAYFSNPNLVRILFPTLLACCVGNPQNRTLLDQEVSYQLLEDFRNAQDSKDIPLIKLLQAD